MNYDDLELEPPYILKAAAPLSPLSVSMNGFRKKIQKEPNYSQIIEKDESEEEEEEELERKESIAGSIYDIMNLDDVNEDESGSTCEENGAPIDTTNDNLAALHVNDNRNGNADVYSQNVGDSYLSSGNVAQYGSTNQSSDTYLDNNYVQNNDIIQEKMPYDNISGQDNADLCGQYDFQQQEGHQSVPSYRMGPESESSDAYYQTRGCRPTLSENSENLSFKGPNFPISPTNLPLNLGNNTDSEDNVLSIHYELERGEPNGNSDFMMEEDDYQKLRTLYEARGREIDRHFSYIEELKYEHREELSKNFKENLILKSENAQLKISNEQQIILIDEYEERIQSLVKNLEEVERKSEKEIKINKELNLKLELAQSTVYSLERQVAELKNANLYNKSNKAEDRYHKKLKKCFEDNVTDLELQVRKLKNKLKESEESYAQSENKFKELKLNSDDVLAQKMDEINRLKKYSDHEELYLQQNEKITALEAKEKELQLNLKSTKHSLAVAVEHLDSYDRMNKFGVLKYLYQTEERSVDQMGLCKELKFEKSDGSLMECSNRSSIKSLDSNAIDKLKQELITCLVSNQKCRKYIKSLQENVESKSKEVEYIKSKLKSHQDGSRITLPNHCSVVEENLYLKTLLNHSLNQFQHLIDKTELFESRLGEIFTSIQSNEFKNIDSDLINLLINSIKTYAESIQLFNSSQQDYVEKIARDNAMLIVKPYMQLETSFERIDKRFVEFNKYISKLSTSLTSSEIDHLKSIYEDFQKHLHDWKKENAHTLKENVQQKLEVCTLKSKLDAANLLLKKLKTSEEQKQDLLQKTKEKHNTEKQKLSFASLQMKEQHEKELESLRNQISELDKKISAVQNNYSTVCKEKNAIEDKYEALMLRQKDLDKKGENISLNKDLLRVTDEKVILGNRIVELEVINEDLESKYKRLMMAHDQLSNRPNRKNKATITDEVTSSEEDISALKKQISECQNDLLEERQKFSEERLAFENKLKSSKEMTNISSDDIYSGAIENYEQNLAKSRNEIEKLTQELQTVKTTSHIIIDLLQKRVSENTTKCEQFQLKEIQLQERLEKMKSEKCLLIENHEKDIKQIIDLLHAEDQKNMEMKVQLNDIEAFYAKTIAELNKDINKDTKRIDALEAENKSKDEICEVVRVEYNRMKVKYVRFKESYEEKIAKLKEQKKTMGLEHVDLVRRQLKDFHDYLANATASIDKLFVPIIDNISLLNRRCNIDLTSHIKDLIGLQKGIKHDLVLHEDSLKIVQKVQQ